MHKSIYISIFVSALAAISIQNPLYAQQSINANAMEKVKFYNAPRQIQIIDDRPIIRDFREAPSNSSRMVNIPPGPGGSGTGNTAGVGGMYGGTPNSIPLPKADFGHSVSNIPARGMAPNAALPNGKSIGVHTKTAAPIKTAARQMPSQVNTRKALPARGSTPTSAAQYQGGYGDVGSGSATRSGHSTTSLHGKLLNHK